ncbi:MAG: AI-2E family transporter [Dechloromonas sp.]|nr:AI-2E family transporter [Dechloromonas sp.]
MIPEADEYRSGPIVWVGVIASTCAVLFFFQKILWLVVPFILALIIYYLLLPLKHRLLMAGVSHDGAAGLVAGSAFLALALGFVLLLPGVAAHAVTWQESSLRYLEGGLSLVTATLQQLEERVAILAQARVSEELARQVSEHSDKFAQKYLGEFALGLAAWAPSLLLAPFLAFFMLRDGWRFKRFLGRAVPNAFFERTLYLLDQVDRTARLYFVGLMQLTLLDAACLALGLWVIGISGALLLGLATAVLAWVPYIGSILGCVLVVLVAATDFPGRPEVAYAAVGLFIIVRMLDDFVFMPMTVGKSLNMHPLLTVLMIFVGGAVAGVPGLMLVLPVLGVAMVFGETLGLVLTDPRLRARHSYAKQLRQASVTTDLRA